MDVVDVLRGAAGKVYDSVKDMAGTAEACGDFGVGAGGDISRNIDVTAEKAVMDHLTDSGLGCTVLGEECGKVELPGEPGGFVIMDAVDGSANAVRGLPFFCCSLAFATKYTLDSVTDAVVADLTTGDMYWASKKKGAFLNNTRIRVAGVEQPYRIMGVNTSGADAELVSKMIPLFNSSHPRHFGANALEMAFIARGLMDALVDLRGKIRVQDIAAGCLLVREAGGLVVDDKMKRLDSDLEYSARLSFIAASSKGVLDEIAGQIGV